MRSQSPACLLEGVPWFRLTQPPAGTVFLATALWAAAEHSASFPTVIQSPWGGDTDLTDIRNLYSRSLECLWGFQVHRTFLDFFLDF